MLKHTWLLPSKTFTVGKLVFSKNEELEPEKTEVIASDEDFNSVGI